MNLFTFEMKSEFKTLVIYSVTVVAILLLLMLGIYPVFMQSKAEVLQMMSGMPPQFAAIFGFHMVSLFSFEGFFGFSFNYISILGAVMASLITISVFSREKRAKCVDFILTKPIERGDVFIGKLNSVIILLLIFNVFYVATVSFLFVNDGKTELLTRNFIFMALTLLYTQLIFMAVSVVYAVFAKKIRSVSGTATAIGLIAFVLAATVNIFDKEYLTFISFTKYFDPNSAFQSGGYETKYVAAAFLIITICFAVSYYSYCKTDAKAV